MTGTQTGTIGTDVVEWVLLKSTSEDRACDAYKYVIASQLDYTGDGGQPEWYVRYGSTSFDNLLRSNTQLVTLYEEGTTAEQVASDVVAEADRVAQTVPTASTEGIIYLPLIQRTN